MKAPGQVEHEFCKDNRGDVGRTTLGKTAKALCLDYAYATPTVRINSSRCSLLTTLAGTLHYLLCTTNSVLQRVDELTLKNQTVVTYSL
jgi:hypothetical protein